uniref:Guanylate-binding protein N-terminal domain-containing protein n=1 Tax=Calidris pygmaea TaxID=425635 RepID=A0A8C3KD35_9CHAR
TSPRIMMNTPPPPPERTNYLSPLVEKEALQVLAEITKTVVLATKKVYRNGKCYLMEKLFPQRKTSFSHSTVVSDVHSHTKWIWVYSVPQAFKARPALMPLDTEGLGEVKKLFHKGDTGNATRMFALAVLLHNSLIYNIRGTIYQQGMHMLEYPWMKSKKRDGLLCRVLAWGWKNPSSPDSLLVLSMDMMFCP